MTSSTSLATSGEVLVECMCSTSFAEKKKPHRPVWKTVPTAPSGGWLMNEGDVEMAKRCLEHLTECFDHVLEMLHEDEVKMVNKVIDERGDKPVLEKEPVLFEVVDAVMWYCHTITLTADIFGVCSPGTEAQIAYDERLERRKSQKS